MQTENKFHSRKKFILGSIGVVAFFGSLKFFFGKKKKETAKMLTEDGRLVEVNTEFIKKSGKKVSNEEIHHWIKNKPTL